MFILSLPPLTNKVTFWNGAHVGIYYDKRMAMLISIKHLRSPSNTSGCSKVFIHRPIPKRAKTLKGTKKMNCPGGKIELHSTLFQTHASDTLYRRCVDVLLLAPIVIMIGFIILVARYR